MVWCIGEGLARRSQPGIQDANVGVRAEDIIQYHVILPANALVDGLARIGQHALVERSHLNCGAENVVAKVHPEGLELGRPGANFPVGAHTVGFGPLGLEIGVVGASVELIVSGWIAVLTIIHIGMPIGQDTQVGAHGGQNRAEIDVELSWSAPRQGHVIDKASAYIEILEASSQFQRIDRFVVQHQERFIGVGDHRLVVAGTQVHVAHAEIARIVQGVVVVEPETDLAVYRPQGHQDLGNISPAMGIVDAVAQQHLAAGRTHRSDGVIGRQNRLAVGGRTGAKAVTVVVVELIRKVDAPQVALIFGIAQPVQIRLFDVLSG